MTELYIQQGLQTEADAQFAKACAACGKNNRDIESIKANYQKKGWKVPVDVSCGTSMSQGNGNKGKGDNGAAGGKDDGSGDGMSPGAKKESASTATMSPIVMGGAAGGVVVLLVLSAYLFGACGTGEVTPKKNSKGKQKR